MNESGSTAGYPHAEGPTPGPFSALLGFRYVSIDEVESVVEADPGPEHCNGGGIVHGGFLASILDTTTGWAVHARLPEGTAAPHVHLSIQYVRRLFRGRRSPAEPAASVSVDESARPRPSSPSVVRWWPGPSAPTRFWLAEAPGHGDQEEPSQ